MIPQLGFGTWGLTTEAELMVDSALKLGYRMIDTASAYANEREVGKALATSGVPREQLTICTKFPVEFAGKEWEVLDFSLASLQLEYLDVWLLHAPMPARELVRTLEVMREARAGGHVRCLGVSNFSIQQLDWVKRSLGFYPDLNQSYFPLDRTLSATVDSHKRRGIVPMAHSPFHERTRLLTAHSDPKVHEAILSAYIRADVPVVFGSRNPAHLSANLEVFRRLTKSS